MHDKTVVNENRQHQAYPRSGWIRVQASDQIALDTLNEMFGLSLGQGLSHAVEEGDFVLLPVELPMQDRDLVGGFTFTGVRILIALSAELLITVEPDAEMAALRSAQMRVAQLPAGAPSRDALSLVIESLNDSLQETVDRISLTLNDLADEAVDSSGGFTVAGRQVGVADIAQTAVSLGEAEELIARTVRGQLMLERAARWVRRAGPSGERDDSVNLSDIQGGRRHARFQHAKMRNIQQSLMTTLDLKQNQIIKVFTVVTAVFTPPTLIAAYYGQNFANMPELALPWGEWFVMGTTAVFALVPLLYIKRKGWLR